MIRRARLQLVVAAAMVAAVALVSAWPPAAFAGASAGRQASSLRWYKGNLHTHTLNSDGDSTPDDVVKWYREHGYQFLVLTDHNFLTGVDGLNALHSADEQFLVIKGEELTDKIGDKSIHVNGFDVDRAVPVQGGQTVAEMIQRMVDALRGAHGVPSINHPNFSWAITADDLLKLQRTRLFEVFNGHPLVNNLGGGGVPGLEDTWDRILSSGKLMYGIAVDDAHTFKAPGDPNVAGPGRGWVYIRSPRLDARALVEALERGEFYASTGVELRSVDATTAGLTITIKEGLMARYRTQFIGKQGRVLSEATGLTAAYTFRGDEGYVRAKVIESNGRYAWLQPVPVGASSPR
ncbi:MAG: CehA/McbA family metallohydrolase [Vicinamibacterales bacterium]